MFRLKSFVLGAVTFLAAHLVQVSRWATWFEPDASHPAWFLNSGRAVGFTFGCLFLSSAVVSALADHERQTVFRSEANVFAGSVVSMLIVLFASGPGSIFPIVIVFGAAVILVGIVAGAFAGWPLAGWRHRIMGRR